MSRPARRWRRGRPAHRPWRRRHRRCGRGPPSGAGSPCCGAGRRRRAPGRWASRPCTAGRPRTAPDRPKPRASLRAAASIRLGRIEGRMVSSVASIGFSRRTSTPPPPKRSAFFSGRNDQVTASFMPRCGQGTARLRHAPLQAHRAPASTWRRERGSDVVGILSKPATRVTSSTRSASPTMSGRHDGTAAVHGPEPATVKPSLVRMSAVSFAGTSIAVSVFTRSARRVIAASPSPA